MPICFEPVARRTPEALRRKARLCVSGLPSTHWASLGLQHDLARPVHLPQTGQDAPEGKGWEDAVLPVKACVVPACVKPGCEATAVALREEAGENFFIADESVEYGERCLAALKDDIRALL